ncbi:hypothetical protein BK049_18360 [Bacillus xiamenensis]|uniref:Uncharacterized protein n=1 Tax=Bacillus xiamenensis TaxID=1178537 RepID=A0AAC9IIT9_9BACI|nr:hypothetical protein [Bacillus xiamenensis]AOZ90515.1 hypothetical protein BK049_18360 [Bacillus xiamenensis]MBG9912799.1 hypothetical protein [Bacillus xiamenensis]MCY9576872.1 hypothetical protein [Bacillus xiamenensis]
MSLTSRIKNNKEFRDIISTIAPLKEDYTTLSGKLPFSKKYTCLVESNLPHAGDSSLVGMAFDYLARFRIGQVINNTDAGQYLTALKGMKKLQIKTANFNLVGEYYTPLHTAVYDFIKNNQELTDDIILVALRLGKLEQFFRMRVPKSFDKNEFLTIQRSDLLIPDLKELMAVFEEKFISSGIVNKKSEVVFNPNFGISSFLVDGADADIVIDGVLYDFKTTGNFKYDSKDSLQLSGYFLLNRFLREIEDNHLIIGSLNYDKICFNKVCLYKARFGEFECYDFDVVNEELLNDTVIDLAGYFDNNPGRLNNIFLVAPLADQEGYRNAIKKIANKNKTHL